MLFAHPSILWLLVLAPAVAAAGWRASPRWAVAALRVVATGLIVLAAAGPVRVGAGPTPMRVAVVDVSPTMSDAAVSAAVAAARGAVVVGVSNRAERLAGPIDAAVRRRLAEPLWPGDPAGGGSALADGLRLAGGLVPPGGAAEVTLATNGLATRGDAAAEAARLAARGIPVRVTAADVAPAPPLARSASMPAAGSVGQAVPVTVTVEATAAGVARVSVRPDGGPPVGGTVSLRPGRNAVTYPVPLARAGVMTVHVVVNDREPVAAAVAVAAAPVILVVQDADDGTAAALRSSLGPAADVRVAAPPDLDRPGALRGVSVVALANLPAARLSPAAQQLVHDAVVRDGTGLLVCGADRSFGAGGYADAAALAPLLPVRLPRPAQQLDPSVALVFVIDTSGSMVGNRIDLAKQVARLAVGRLTPRDQAGIVEFFGAKRWASPLQTVGDKLEVTRALDRLSVGGGTVLYPAVEEAAFALRNSTAASRHVLILSDGDVENTPFETLARGMAKDGITVSAGRCGNPDGEGDFLSNIAHWGHGRYYEVADRFSLPDVAFKRPRTIPASPVVVDPQAVVPGNDPLARPFGADAWPAVGQFARTPAKPAADVLLATAGGDPLLARWRVGAGWVVAAPVDLGSAAAGPLLASAGFGPLLRSVLADVAGGRDGLRVRPVVRPAGLDVAVDAVRADVDPTAPIRVELDDGRTATAPPLSPGRWDVLFPGVTPGTRTVRAAVADAAGTAAVPVPVPRALSRLTPDVELLAAIASPPGGVARPSVAPQGEPVELWIPFALSALACFLAHVAARRWPARVRVPAVRGVPAPALAAVAVLCAVTVARGAEPIDARIHAALVATGDVAGIVATSPADRAAVAHERGDRSAELAALEQLADPARLAAAQEFAGDDAAAERAWRGVEPPSADAALRLAVLLLDDGRVQPGLAALSQAAAAARPPTSTAGIVAVLYGQDAAAVDLLPRGDRTAELLRGEGLLRLGRAADAAAAFAAARASATSPADQRYLAERQVAAARRGGTLDALADRWLEEGDKLPLPSVAPLAGVLRDEGRAGPLLDLWSALVASADPARRDAALSPAMVAEVVGAAIDAGRGDRAVAVTRQVLDRNPRSGSALNSAVRVALDTGDAAGADALLDARSAGADPDTVRRVGDLAASLGRDAVAGRCADRLVAAGGADAVAGLLLRAQLQSARGDAAAGVASLRQAASLVTDASQATPVADALDVAGRRPAAIALLQRFAGPASADVDLLGQLGWLLGKANRAADAQAVYQRVWAAADTDATRAQAEQRMLALAAQTGDLDRLRDAAAGRLKSPAGTRADLTLVVDADVRAHDPAAAVAALSASPLAGSDRDRLGSIADVWLRTEHPDQAAAALAKLRDAQSGDPAGRRLTLQRLAEVDLRRDRPDLARRDVADAAAGTDGETAALLLADILSRSDDPAAAADQYRRALAIAGPTGDADAWLPWAQAMAKAGRRDGAIARLQSLCGDAAAAGNDGRLGVGVDGLLNLDAPAAALRPVRRLVILRVAAAPQRSIDAHLLADLSDQLREATLGRRALAVGLAADPEQRADRLRVLVDAARSANDADAALDFGRRLLGTGEALPPSLFLDLGQQLLADGRDAEAVRALDRATEVSADDVVRRRSAALAERAVLPVAAARLLAPVAARTPSDLALRVELANEYEAAGQDDRAEVEYRAALKLALDRLPAAAAHGADDGAAGAGNPKRVVKRRPVVVVRRLTVDPVPPPPLPDDVRLPLVGALACAADGPGRDAVVDVLVRHGDAALSAAPPGGPVPADVAVLAAAVRQAAFAAGRPDVADAFDRRLLAARPDDADLRDAAVQARLFAGLYDGAAALLKPTDARPPVLDVRAAVAATRPSAVVPRSAVWAAAVAPQLLVRDRGPDAAEMLAALPRPAADAALPVAQLTVAAAAHALGRQGQVDGIAAAFADPAGPPRQLPTRVANVAAVWPVVSPDVRRMLNDRLAAAAGAAADPNVAAPLARVALATADGTRPDAAELAARLVGPGLAERTSYFDGLGLLNLLSQVPADRRGDVAAAAMTNARPALRPAWALEAIGDAAGPLPPAVADALASGAVASPGQTPPDHGGERHAGRLPWTPWFANADQPDLVRRACDGLVPAGSTAAVYGPPAPSAVAAPPVDLQSLVAVAAGRALLGQAAEADADARAAVDRLRRELPADPVKALAPRAEWDATGSVPATSVELLRLATAALSPAARDRLVATVRADAPAAVAGGGWRAVADALVLDAAGRRADGLHLLRAASARHLRDPVVVAALVRRLRFDGRTAELVDLLRARLYDAGSADATLLPDLTAALASLGRLDEVRRFTFATDADAQVVGLALHAAVAAGDRVRAERAFRTLLVLSRGHGSTAGDPVVGVSPATIGQPRPASGGLLDADAAADDETGRRRAVLACPPAADVGGSAELARQFDVLPVGPSTAVEAVARMLATAAAADPAVAGPLLDHLSDLCRRDALTANHWRLLDRLAASPTVTLPADLRAALWDAALTATTPVRGHLAADLAAQGDAAGADAVLRWMTALADVTGRDPDGWSGGQRETDPFAPAAAPPGPSPAPRPMEPVQDGPEADRLIGLIAAGRRADAAAEVAGLVAAARVSVPSHPRVMLVRARLAADDGDPAEFGRRFAAVLDAWLWSDAVTRLDVRVALPTSSSAEPSADVAAVADRAVAALVSAADRFPGDGDPCRLACVVGAWADDRHDRAAAERALDAGRLLGVHAGDGEHELWLADLADRLGRTDWATDLQARLLAERRLPPARIATVLAAVRRRGDPTAADRLASTAGSYTQPRPSSRPSPARPAVPQSRP